MMDEFAWNILEANLVNDPKHYDIKTFEDILVDLEPFERSKVQTLLAARSYPMCEVSHVVTLIQTVNNFITKNPW